MGSLFVRQAGIVCWQDRKVVLVSEDGKNWRIPVVTVSEGAAKHKQAEDQAWEEAGVLGYAEEAPLGEYLHSGGGKMYKVEVFELEARKYRDKWPQSGRLKRTLLDPGEAADKVDEFGLRDIFSRLSRR